MERRKLPDASRIRLWSASEDDGCLGGTGEGSFSTFLAAVGHGGRRRRRAIRRARGGLALVSDLDPLALGDGSPAYVGLLSPIGPAALNREGAVDLVEHGEHRVEARRKLGYPTGQLAAQLGDLGGAARRSLRGPASRPAPTSPRPRSRRAAVSSRVARRPPGRPARGGRERRPPGRTRADSHTTLECLGLIFHLGLTSPSSRSSNHLVLPGVDGFKAIGYLRHQSSESSVPRPSVRIVHCLTVVKSRPPPALTTAKFSTVSQMEGSRRQPGMLQGLSRFLVQHERCGAGFDVAHPAGLGSGGYRSPAAGCGARHEYATATIEVERELKIEPAERRAQPQPPAPAQARAPQPKPRAPGPNPPRPAPYLDSGRPPAPSPPPSGATGDTAAAAPTGDLPPVGPGPTAGAAPAQRTSPSPTCDATGHRAATPGAPPLRRPPAESAPSGVWRSAPGRRLPCSSSPRWRWASRSFASVNDNGGSTPSTTPPPPRPTHPRRASPLLLRRPRRRAARRRLRSRRRDRRRRRCALETSPLQAPAGWTDRTSAGGLLLQPRGGGRVNVQVYFQRSPGLSRSQMTQQTARFLRHEVPGASLFPRQITIAGRPAYEITARGPGETAIAVDVLRGPYRYLLLRRIFAGATPQVSVAASRVVMSFRPR